MYLLYLDESGNPDSSAEQNFVLAGAAVFERVTYHLSQAFDDLQRRYFPEADHVEFHASPIRSGKGFWRKVAKPVRDDVLEEMGQAIAAANAPGVVLFGAVVDRRLGSGEEVVRRATEQCCRRFDLFLRRRGAIDDPQRGLIIFAEGRFDRRAKLWVREFRQLGTAWGTLRHLSDIPYFASASETRPLQVADFVAHALYSMYERGDGRLLRSILPRFDRKDGVLHGLAHLTPDWRECECPACSTRREPGTLHAWLRREKGRSELAHSASASGETAGAVSRASTGAPAE
jgi:hypothetical protein